MRAVEIRLRQRELSEQMAAMRVWLDEHRFEPSTFYCREKDDAMLIRVEFKIADQADAFARHFGGRANGYADEELAQQILETGLSPGGVIG